MLLQLPRRRQSTSAIGHWSLAKNGASSDRHRSSRGSMASGSPDNQADRKRSATRSSMALISLLVLPVSSKTTATGCACSSSFRSSCSAEPATAGSASQSRRHHRSWVRTKSAAGHPACLTSSFSSLATLSGPRPGKRKQLSVDCRAHQRDSTPATCVRQYSNIARASSFCFKASCHRSRVPEIAIHLGSGTFAAAGMDVSGPLRAKVSDFSSRAGCDALLCRSSAREPGNSHATSAMMMASAKRTGNGDLMPLQRSLSGISVNTASTPIAASRAYSAASLTV